MSRSLKKPPFVHYKLMKRVDDAQESSSKAVIKTWSRASTITPEFDFRCSQRQQVHSCIRYGKYGRSQTRRIFPYSKLPWPRR